MSEQRQQLANNLLNILQQKRGESKGISDIPIPMRKPFANVEAQEKLGDVEMRADLDPYTSVSPLAKLGYKLFEDGKLSIRGIPFDRLNPSTEDKSIYYGGRGLYIKSEDAIDAPSEKRAMRQLEKYGIERKPMPEYGMATFNFMRDIMPSRDRLNTLNHELAHAGIEFLVQNMNDLSEEDQKTVKKSLFFDGRRSIKNKEEGIMDAMEQEIKEKNPELKIEAIDIFDRVKLLGNKAYLIDQTLSEEDQDELLKEVSLRAEQVFNPAVTLNSRSRLRKLNEIAEKELRKMNVPEKQEQIGTLGKVKRYFEGIF